MNVIIIIIILYTDMYYGKINNNFLPFIYDRCLHTKNNVHKLVYVMIDIY